MEHDGGQQVGLDDKVSEVLFRLHQLTREVSGRGAKAKLNEETFKKVCEQLELNPTPEAAAGAFAYLDFEGEGVVDPFALFDEIKTEQQKDLSVRPDVVLKRVFEKLLNSTHSDEESDRESDDEQKRSEPLHGQHSSSGSERDHYGRIRTRLHDQGSDSSEPDEGDALGPPAYDEDDEVPPPPPRPPSDNLEDESLDGHAQLVDEDSLDTPGAHGLDDEYSEEQPSTTGALATPSPVEPDMGRRDSQALGRADRAQRNLQAAADSETDLSRDISSSDLSYQQDRDQSKSSSPRTGKRERDRRDDALGKAGRAEQRLADALRDDQDDSGKGSSQASESSEGVHDTGREKRKSKPRTILKERRREAHRPASKGVLKERKRETFRPGGKASTEESPPPESPPPPDDPLIFDDDHDYDARSDERESVGRSGGGGSTADMTSLTSITESSGDDTIPASLQDRRKNVKDVLKGTAQRGGEYGSRLYDEPEHIRKVQYALNRYVDDALARDRSAIQKIGQALAGLESADGDVDFNRFEQLMNDLGVNLDGDECEKLFEVLDLERTDSVIDFQRVYRRDGGGANDVKSLFERLSLRGDGKVDMDAFNTIVGKHLNCDLDYNQIEDIFEECDKVREGVVTHHDFVIFLNDAHLPGDLEESRAQLNTAISKFAPQGGRGRGRYASESEWQTEATSEVTEGSSASYNQQHQRRQRDREQYSREDARDHGQTRGGETRGMENDQRYLDRRRRRKKGTEDESEILSVPTDEVSTDSSQTSSEEMYDWDYWTRVRKDVDALHMTLEDIFGSFLTSDKIAELERIEQLFREYGKDRKIPRRKIRRAIKKRGLRYRRRGDAKYLADDGHFDIEDPDIIVIYDAKRVVTTLKPNRDDQNSPGCNTAGRNGFRLVDAVLEVDRKYRIVTMSDPNAIIDAPYQIPTHHFYRPGASRGDRGDEPEIKSDEDDYDTSTLDKNIMTCKWMDKLIVLRFLTHIFRGSFQHLMNVCDNEYRKKKTAERDDATETGLDDMDPKRDFESVDRRDPNGKGWLLRIEKDEDGEILETEIPLWTTSPQQAEKKRRWGEMQEENPSVPLLDMMDLLPAVDDVSSGDFATFSHLAPGMTAERNISGFWHWPDEDRPNYDEMEYWGFYSKGYWSSSSFRDAFQGSLVWTGTIVGVNALFFIVYMGLEGYNCVPTAKDGVVCGDPLGSIPVILQALTFTVYNLLGAQIARTAWFQNKAHQFLDRQKMCCDSRLIHIMAYNCHAISSTMSLMALGWWITYCSGEIWAIMDFATFISAYICLFLLATPVVSAYSYFRLLYLNSWEANNRWQWWLAIGAISIHTFFARLETSAAGEILIDVSIWAMVALVLFTFVPYNGIIYPFNTFLSGCLEKIGLAGLRGYATYQPGEIDAKVISPHAAVILIPATQPILPGHFVEISTDRKQWVRFPVCSLKGPKAKHNDLLYEDTRWYGPGGDDDERTVKWDQRSFPPTLSDDSTPPTYGVYVGGRGDWTKSFVYALSESFETVPSPLYVKDQLDLTCFYHAPSYSARGPVLYCCTDGGIAPILPLLEDQNRSDEAYLIWLATNPEVTYGQIYSSVCERLGNEKGPEGGEKFKKLRDLTDEADPVKARVSSYHYDAEPSTKPFIYRVFERGTIVNSELDAREPEFFLKQTDWSGTGYKAVFLAMSEREARRIKEGLIKDPDFRGLSIPIYSPSFR